MLRAYYDGSGLHADSAVFTLAGVVASQSVWTQFELRWNAVLAQHRTDKFHMSDAQALKGTFSREKGWTEELVGDIVRDLWNVIGQFRACERFQSGTNMIASSCSVVRKGYDRAKKEKPRLRSLEAICLNFCFNVLPRDIDSDKNHPEVSLVFDTNEPFLKTIHSNWIKYRGRSEAGWPSQIKSIDKGNSLGLAPLQAADLLAWTINKHHRKPGPWAAMTFLLVEHYTKVYDYQGLLEQFPDG